MGILSKISERHILALNLLFLLPLLFDPRMTAGIVGYMNTTYSPLFSRFLGIWASVSVAYLILFRVKPYWFVICGMPILAYLIMGSCWWLSSPQTVPTGAVFLPLIILIDSIWLIGSRIKATRTGHHLDETIPPPIGGEYDKYSRPD